MLAFLTFAEPVNAKPSIVKFVAALSKEITPLIIASAFLVAVLGLIPSFGPTIVKLATEIFTFSSYSPARIIILSPAFAFARASAIVATA